MRIEGWRRWWIGRARSARAVVALLVATLLVATLLVATLGCSTVYRYTPAPDEGAALESFGKSARKNAFDCIEQCSGKTGIDSRCLENACELAFIREEGTCDDSRVEPCLEARDYELWKIPAAAAAAIGALLVSVIVACSIESCDGALGR